MNTTINIGEPILVLQQIWKYPELTVGSPHLQEEALMKPLHLTNGNCGNRSDCAGCTYLVYDTTGNVQTVLQNGNPMAVVCGGDDSEPLVYLEYSPKE